MKKKEKIRLNDFKRKVEEIENNPRYIELKAKSQECYENECDMANEEFEELVSLYDEHRIAIDAYTNALKRDTIRLWRKQLWVASICLGFQLTALIAAIVIVITKLL